MPNTQGYWDGERWTEHVAPLQQPPVVCQAQPEPDYSGLATAGYILGLLLPLVGFIIGVVLLSKRPGHGLGAMLVSVVGFLFWYHVLTNG